MPYASLWQKMRVSLECQEEERKDAWRRSGIIAWHVLMGIPTEKGRRKPGWSEFQRQLGIRDDRRVLTSDSVQEEVRKAYRVLEMVEGRSFG